MYLFSQQPSFACAAAVAACHRASKARIRSSPANCGLLRVAVDISSLLLCCVSAAVTVLWAAGCELGQDSRSII